MLGRWDNRPSDPAYYVKDCRISYIFHRPADSSDTDYIMVVKGTGCSSSVGRVTGEQTLSLGEGCQGFSPDTIIHEFIHAIGFHHEHARPDRNYYIDVQWDNIIPNERGIYIYIRFALILFRYKRVPPRTEVVPKAFKKMIFTVNERVISYYNHQTS